MIHIAYYQWYVSQFQSKILFTWEPDLLVTAVRPLSFTLSQPLIKNLKLLPNKLKSHLPPPPPVIQKMNAVSALLKY